MFPRYFTSRTADPQPQPPARGPLLLHVLDVFRLGGRFRSQREVAVVVDRGGALHLCEPEALPPALLAEVHAHELASGGRTRLLDVEELWLMSVQLLEQPADVPGLNDPVYLYGRLHGPLAGESAQMAEGQLALTRTDLLDGVVRASPDRFAGCGSACLHLALPADRAEAIEQGRGLVLAWPLTPPELSLDDPGNELLVAGLVYDVLAATRADARSTGQPHPLAELTIPVPSRDDLKRDLEAQGWEVTGDRAVRRTEVTRKGLGSVFAQVFGVPDAMKLELPPEASVDELLRLADQVLPGYPGFPDRRALAVRARTIRGAGSPASPPPEPKIPRPAVAAAAAAPPPPPVQDRDWMDDFVQAHGPKPRMTRLHKKPTKQEPPSKPDWMKDFEDD